jgi:aminoglycoside/choline kinase family phosphotransferase
LADRARRIEAFLAANGWHWGNSKLLAGDASFRSYRRLENGGKRAVLMDAPPPHEDVRPFLRIARHLRGLGLSAPDILAEDVEAGLLLLEDGDAEEPLYALAVDVLAHLHRLPATTAVPPALPPYDDARMLDEALLLTDWYMPAALGDATPRAVRQTYIEAWREILPRVGAQPRTLVLRDFHVDNLMRLPGREGTAACGLLDFQDAVAGPAAYDLMSLLEDARRDISDALKATMLARYRQGVPGLDWAVFETVFAILAAQRHAKVIGIFTRLCRRDGKPGYLIHIPRVWRLLESALGHPAVAPVAAWFERYLPRGARGIPTCRPAAE